MTQKKCFLLEIVGLLYTWIHSVCDSVYKAIQVQPKPDPSEETGVGCTIPPLAVELLQLLATGREKDYLL